ncbi:MAG: SpoIIE family protein phosphatase [Phormidium sp. BM_Day4_Bin.17]|nr:SpoIIE family protein phosphatase [Phormidium sp. BM_Day4_Bin.17]UCJ11351.1 MAG: SpoIIE family protein phosphatase [Phormidium sp. PBR-2020]
MMLELDRLSHIYGSSLESLTLNSTLEDLTLEGFSLDHNVPGRILVQHFNEKPLLPGVILLKNGHYMGMISRRKCLEIMSRPYGIELFYNRPLQCLYDFVKTEIVCYPGDSPIFAAARQCLERSPENLYEPLIVILTDGSHRLLDVHKLLIAQSQLYEVASKLLDKRRQDLDQANAEVEELNQRLKAENLRLSHEVNIAHQLQQMLLPTEQDLQKIPDLDIAAYMEPAAEVGGDYYDILPHADGVKIGIGDVTGHGLESGVFTIMVQTAIRTLLTAQETDPVRFLNTLNRTIYDNVERMNSDRNLTLSLIDYHQGRLQLSGQHEEAILLRRDGSLERIDTLDLGFPIGLDAEISQFIQPIELALHPGDTLILYTDGITEAEDPNGDFYGLDRLCEVARRHAQDDAEQIQQAIIEHLKKYINGHKIYDDITLLVLQRKLEGNLSHHPHVQTEQRGGRRP